MRNLAFIKPFHWCDFRNLFYSTIFFYIAAWMAAMVFGLITTHIKGNSPFYVGLIGFSFNFPMLFGSFIGVVVEQNQRITILKIVALLAMLAAISMAIILEYNGLNMGIVLLDALIYGFCGAFYYPAVLTATHDIISDAKVVGSGLSIINSTNRIMMFFGYGLGGILVSYFSEQFCFYFNALSFFLSFLFLVRVTTKTSIVKEKKSTLAELKAGFFYIRTSPPVLAVLVLMSLMGLLAWPYLFQVPIINRYYLHGTPGTLGLLLAIGGIGGTLGALLISARKNPLGLNRIFIISTFLLSLSMILLALCHTVFSALFVIFLLDFCLMVTLTVGIIFIQQVLPKEYLGRIMGILSMVSFGTIPIGSVIFYGGIGEIFNVMHAFILAALILVIGAVWYIKQLPKIRQFAMPILIERGLIEHENDFRKI